MWQDMLQRCYNTKNKYYKDYGGRGIKIGSEWKEDQTKFFEWADLHWKKGLQIDRVDNNGDYTAENCRFVTSYTNIHNQRIIRSTNTSGYTGVSFSKKRKVYHVSLVDKFKGYSFIGTFSCKHKAAEARNDFIIKHNLPHSIQEIVR